MGSQKQQPSISVQEIADTVRGQLIGDGTVVVHGLCPLDAPLAGCLAFSRSNSLAAIRRNLGSVAVAAVLIPPGAKAEDLKAPPAFIIVNDPMQALFSLVPRFYTSPPAQTGISPLASIDPSATIGAGASIGAFCAIGPGVIVGEQATLHPRVTIYAGSTIGARTVLHSGVSVREYSEIGDDCIIHCGTVIGADGFGFVPAKDGTLKKVPQIGTVRIGNHVEIGANCCIDRGALGITEIGQGTKIDNLVQVGHNVRIGRSAILCGQVGIAGSATIGDGAVLGGQVGVRDHVTVASRARVGARSGVSSDIEAGDYAGYPAVPAAEWRRQIGAIARLPALMRRLNKESRDEEE